MSTVDQPVSAEMQALIDETLKARETKNAASAAYRDQVHSKILLNAKVLELRKVASDANEAYATLWQKTREYLPKE